jgi:hypothetical protein
MRLDYFKMIAFGRKMSRGGSRNDTFGVKILMIPLVFASLMKSPVFIKIVACAQGPKSKYGLRAWKLPFCSCDFEVIFDEMPSRSLYNSRGNGDPCER